MDPRGQLFQASISFITEAQPKAFVLENVCGLIRNNGGIFLQSTLEHIRQAGYRVAWAKLNSLDMGLPHNRPRLYIWGIRDDAADELPSINTGGAADALCLADRLDNGHPLPASEWPKVDAILPTVAAACVKKAAARSDTLALEGQDWIVDEQLSRSRGGIA